MNVTPVARPDHTWADLMRRGLDLDVLECPRGCVATLRFIARIEQPAVVRKILRHLGLPSDPVRCEPARAPPDQDAMDWAS